MGYLYDIDTLFIYGLKSGGKADGSGGVTSGLVTAVSTCQQHRCEKAVRIAGKFSSMDCLC